MFAFLMRRPRDLCILNKQVRRKLKRNQAVLIAPSDMMLTRARFGVLVKWKQIMYRRGLKAVQLQPRIARCFAKPTIEQKEIDKINRRKNLISYRVKLILKHCKPKEGGDEDSVDSERDEGMRFYKSQEEFDDNNCHKKCCHKSRQK